MAPIFAMVPNPVFKPKNAYHPFDGDGMVHAVYIRDGKASYRNSYNSYCPHCNMSWLQTKRSGPV